MIFLPPGLMMARLAYGVEDYIDFWTDHLNLGIYEQAAGHMTAGKSTKRQVYISFFFSVE
jgi:hypothetical protein